MLIFPTKGFAHAGKVDAKGCHKDSKTGQYHCHETANASYVGVASVIDGDTIEIHGERFRLFGIDAPEAKQLCKGAKGKPYRCGQVAANALSDLIVNQTVTCEKRDVDRYQRIVAVCEVNGQDVGAYLVATGLAVAYVQYSKSYVPQQNAARQAGLGLWAGAFEMPWDWRRAH
jgi:endonuclease YncB( thermonuclease family)